MPLNIDWQQILLHLLNFTILFGILYFLLYKPVKDFMDKRVQHYQEMDEQAKEALAAAEAARTEQEQKLAAADGEISAMKDAARSELNHALAERKEQAEEEAQKILAHAKAAAQREHQRAVAQAQDEITAMVTDATEKILSDGNPSDAFDRFLAQAQRGESNE
ncbi:MAG: ATP synthase F0 subunit B [Clostridia bacterium]|nr:ATP synthase F0 subunit B [Clostridia bacterium]MBQ7090240.1 ATP synthase F0 subunit B [Clostridia bacterium]